MMMVPSLEKCKSHEILHAKGFGDKTFTRNDLQKVIGEVVGSDSP